MRGEGSPLIGTVEIAYGTIEEYRKQRFGTTICRKIAELSIDTDPSIETTARTFQKENAPTRMPEKNNLVCVGRTNNPEDREAWQQVYKAMGSLNS